MELLAQIVEFVQNSPTQALMLIASIAVIAWSLMAAALIRQPVFRVVFMLLVGGITLYLSAQTEMLTHDFFLNTSTEFLGAVVAIMILDGMLDDDLMSPWWIMIFVIGIVFVTPFFIDFVQQRINLEEAFSVNFHTEILGAFAIFTLTNVHRLFPGRYGGQARRRLHREQRKLDDMQGRAEAAYQEGLSSLQNQLSRIKQMDHFSADLRKPHDIELRILGGTKDDLKTKIEQLSSIMTLKTSSKNENGQLSAYGVGSLLKKQPPAQTLEVDHLEIFLKGRQETIDKTLDILREVLEIDQEPDQLIGGQCHCVAALPAVPMWQALHDYFHDISQTWSNGAEIHHEEETSEDYRQGYLAARHHAAAELMEKVKVMIDA